MDNREPIFFAWTRSFWLGLFPAILTGIDMLIMVFNNADLAGPVAATIAAALTAVSGLPYLDWLATTPAQINAFMLAIAPIYALIVGQQRMHAARPYTIDPRAIE